MADITANVDAWSTNEASNSPAGSTTIGTGLAPNLRAIQVGVRLMFERSKFAGAFVINGKITRSVGSNALTIALKGNDGNDPSATNKVYVLFPTVTSNVFDGGYAIRTVSAAVSLVISSTSTLGHASTVASPVYIYLLDNSGTIELAVSNKFFGGMSVQSTTAEGGAGAADSATALYSTTARSNVAVVCLQRWKSTQTTAGTWAATTGEVQLYPFPYKKPKVTRVTATGAFTKDWDTLWLEHYVKAGGASGGGSSATGFGGGGGEGEEGWRVIDQADHDPSLTVTIGAGGAAINANTNASGNTGGTTSIGTHTTAIGGAGGTSGNSGGAGGLGGTGGTGADYYMKGAPGTPGSDSSGAATSLNNSGGGKGAGSGGPAQNGAANTGGGGNGGSTAATSGAGGSGVAVLTEHYC